MDIIIKIINEFKKIPYDLKQVKTSSKRLMINIPLSVLIGGTFALFYYGMLNRFTFTIILITTFLSYKGIFICSPKYFLPLEITNIEPLVLTNNRVRAFKILLRNPSTENILLKSVAVNWNYIHGAECSLEIPREIAAANPIQVELQVNINDETRKTTTIPLKRPVEFPANSGNIEFEITVYYTIISKCSWHPCSDWNISFNIKFEDFKGRKIEIIPERLWIDFNRWDPAYIDLWLDHQEH